MQSSSKSVEWSGIIYQSCYGCVVYNRISQSRQDRPLGPVFAATVKAQKRSVASSPLYSCPSRRGRPPEPSLPERQRPRRELARQGPGQRQWRRRERRQDERRHEPEKSIPIWDVSKTDNLSVIQGHYFTSKRSILARPQRRPP